MRMAEYASEIEFVAFSPHFTSIHSIFFTSKPIRFTDKENNLECKGHGRDDNETDVKIACVSTFQGVNERYNFQIHPAMTLELYSISLYSS